MSINKIEEEFEEIPFIQSDLNSPMAKGIIEWTKVAYGYDDISQNITGLVFQAYNYASQYLSAQNSICWFIRNGIPEDKREILDKTDSMASSRLLSKPENLEWKKKRAAILKKIRRLFNLLGKAVYGDAFNELNPLANKSPDSKSVRDDTSIQSNTKSTKSNKSKSSKSNVASNESTTTTPVVKKSTKKSTKKSKDSDDEPDDEDDETVEYITPNKQWKNKPPGIKKVDEKELYETPIEVIDAIKENVLQLFPPPHEKWILFEPCCGNGRISNYFRNLGYTVIERDLYTTEEKHDYLIEDAPFYDCLITNPPFHLKAEFIKKAMGSEKPWIMLLPTESTSIKKTNMYFNNDMAIQILSPPPKFDYHGKKVAIKSCAWFYANIKGLDNRFSIYHMNTTREVVQHNKRRSNFYIVEVEDDENDELDLDDTISNL
eukprot:gene29308-38834_t